MSKRNSREGKAERRSLRERARDDESRYSSWQQMLTHAVQTRDFSSVPEPIRSYLEATDIFPGGEESCRICGDTDAVGYYHWLNENPDVIGRLCADCAVLQQQMYGDATGDTLIKLEEGSGHGD